MTHVTDLLLKAAEPMTSEGFELSAEQQRYLLNIVQNRLHSLSLKAHGRHDIQRLLVDACDAIERLREGIG